MFFKHFVIAAADRVFPNSFAEQLSVTGSVKYLALSVITTASYGLLKCLHNKFSYFNLFFYFTKSLSQQLKSLLLITLFSTTKCMHSCIKAHSQV